MNRFQATKIVAIMGVAANILLLGLKLAVGFLSRSQAMIADGFNSAGDVFASAMTYIGNKIASQPEDKNHPYGHGKAEYIFSMIISFSLLFVAGEVLKSSVRAIVSRKIFLFSWWLVAIAVFTILIKLGLYLYTRKVGRREDNLLVLANSEDHRNDVFVTASTLLGIVIGANGIYWLDGVVGIGISIWIVFTGIRIFYSSYRVLMDTNMDKFLEKDIINEIHSINGIDHIDKITAKPIGIKYIIIVKVSVLGDMTVNESHSIAAEIKAKLKNLKNVGDVVVHINPA
ncbi:MAG TPA: cation transporter [Clostridiaceae bacterium]|nr:cation transporter [Clostridiaceae bacterium]